MRLPLGYMSVKSHLGAFPFRYRRQCGCIGDNAFPERFGKVSWEKSGHPAKERGSPIWVEMAGIEWAPDPVPHRLVLRVPRVGQRGQEPGVPVRTADVLGRARVLAG